MNSELFDLENGIRCSVVDSPLSELVSIQTWVGVGSLHERSDERGMAHLLEHMLFKGTAKRKVGEIARIIESNGGDVNAYTTFDRTVYYVTLPADRIEIAMDVLSDSLFHSAFDPEELEREKEVVIEEIRRSLDNPSTLVSRKLFAHAFAGCEAERPIIGSVESVLGFSREQILDFYRGWYHSKNVHVVIAGNLSQVDVRTLCDRYFGQVKPINSPRKHRESIANFPDQMRVEVIKGDYQQPRLEFCFEAPPYFETDAMYLDLCAYALGHGDASRLNRRLKDERHLVSAIAASTYTPEFGGMFSVSSYPLLEKIPEVVKAIVSELHKFRTSEPITEDEILRARANTRAEYYYQEETVGGLARSIGFNLTTPFKQHYDSVYLSTINNATATQVMAAFRRWCLESKLVVVASVPEASTLTEDEIRKAYLGALSSQQPSKPVSRKSETPSLTEIVPGMNLIYRQVPQTKFFSMTLAKAGGLRFESRDSAGIYHALALMLGRASKDYGFEEMLALTERTGASIDGFSGKDSLGMRMHCLADDTEKILPAFFSSLQDPVFPDQQWQAAKLEILEDIRSQDDHPSQICFREFQKRLYGAHPYHFPQYGYSDSVAKISLSTLSEFYQGSGGAWTVAAVSPLPLTEVLEVTRHQLGASLSTATSRTATAGPLKAEPGHYHISKKREQTHIVVGFPGLKWADPARYALEMLSTILSGQGGRLFLDLRDKQSLAYSVSSLCSFGYDTGVFGAYIACAPDKAEHARNALIEKLFELFSKPPSDEEIERAKRYMIGSHAVEMQRGSGQSMNMALMELYGVGYDEFMKYSDNIKRTSKADVMAAAQKILIRDLLVSVSVG